MCVVSYPADCLQEDDDAQPQNRRQQRRAEREAERAAQQAARGVRERKQDVSARSSRPVTCVGL